MKRVKETSVAARDLLVAAQREAQSDAFGGDWVLSREAERARSRAIEPLGDDAPPVGTGGEVALRGVGPPEIYDTLQRPNMVSATASYQRTRDMYDAGILEAGLDFAESFQARNSIEKGVCHAMAAVQAGLMRTAAEVNALEEELANLDPYNDRAFYDRREHLLTQIRRGRALMNRSLMSLTAAMLALQRVRGGGNQRIRVERVIVDNRVAVGGDVVVDRSKTAAPADGAPSQQ